MGSTAFTLDVLLHTLIEGKKKKKIWCELQTGSCSEETTLEMGSKRKKKKKGKREGEIDAV